MGRIRLIIMLLVLTLFPLEKPQNFDEHFSVGYVGRSHFQTEATTLVDMLFSTIKSEISHKEKDCRDIPLMALS